MRGETELTTTLYIKVMITYSWDSVQERDSKRQQRPKAKTFYPILVWQNL
jgi:hypothetical protein